MNKYLTDEDIRIIESSLESGKRLEIGLEHQKNGDVKLVIVEVTRSIKKMTRLQ